MNERDQYNIYTSKLEILNRDQWTCQKCGGYGTQVAHRISQSLLNIKLYGKEIIHHPYNMVTTDTLICNASFNIGNNPGKVKKLIFLIENMSDDNLTPGFITDFIES